MRLPETTAAWGSHSGDSQLLCRHLTNTSPTCQGVDCTTYEYITLDISGGGFSTLSGFAIGGYGGSYGGPECGESWCSSTRHGRYDGGCQSGPKGEGDWMMLVR